MATYSRSQTTTQTAKSSSVMPSMDISSLLVKTMENVMNENEEESEKTLEEQISEGINSSDLLKDKTKNDTSKELTDLLKDKKNSDKELSALLKDTNKNSKDSNAEKKKGTVKSNSDKASNTLGKIVTGGVIGSAIAGIMGSKGVGGAVKGAVSGAVTGTGKVAGGLISSAGNITGAAIAGIGKLFGPVGAVIGKFVGTAVATPFKIVGGTITAAIGGLGKLINTPLKELLTKGTLITFVLSQLFVFLEGLIAKYKAEKDLKLIDFMAKIKSSVAMIPDKIKLSLEQVLSKVRIMGKPIYGSLTEDEENELGELGIRAKMAGGELGKNDPLYQYDQLFTNKETGIDVREKQNENILRDLQESYRTSGGMDTIDFSQYNLNTTKGREELKAKMLSTISADQKESQGQLIDSWLSDYTFNSSAIDDAKKRATYLEKTNPEIARYRELQDLQNTPRNAEYFEEEKKNLEIEQEQKQAQYAYEMTADYAKKKGGLTAMQQSQADALWGKGSTQEIKRIYGEKFGGEELTTRYPTGAERFLANQYKAWTDSIATAIEHGFQNFIGVKVDLKQKFDQHNPTIKK